MSEKIQLNEPAPSRGEQDPRPLEGVITTQPLRIQLNEPAPVPGWPLPGEPMAKFEEAQKKRIRLDD